MIFDVNLRARDQRRLNFPLVAPLPLAPCFLKVKNGKVGMPIELCIFFVIWCISVGNFSLYLVLLYGKMFPCGSLFSGLVFWLLWNLFFFLP